jgi:hypothetical protein
MPIILATWEAEIERITVKGQLRQIVCETPISNIARAKLTGGMAKVVEQLVCNCEALNSNPSSSLCLNKEQKGPRKNRL